MCHATMISHTSCTNRPQKQCTTNVNVQPNLDQTVMVDSFPGIHSYCCVLDIVPAQSSIYFKTNIDIRMTYTRSVLTSIYV